MSDKNKASEMFEEFSRMAKKYNVTFITATQSKRDDSSSIVRDGAIKQDTVLIIDHINLLKSQK